MAGLKQYSYPGFGEFALKERSYCQAIRVGNIIHCSGQGGWDRDSFEIPTDVKAEVNQAFENIEATLKHAGGKGWSQVYRVWTYSTDIKATEALIIENYRKWMPNHQPVWTELGVKALAAEEMVIEIEVEAYDPKGAAEAEAKK